MCLSIAIRRPEAVLAKGVHAGHEWVVTHNGMGSRCGYVKVEPGHPWHGVGDYEVDAHVHGGITFNEHDIHCDAGGPDSGYWLGFDCAHSGDAPDPALPGYRAGLDMGHVWTQDDVERECRDLCEQARFEGTPATEAAP